MPTKLINPAFLENGRKNEILCVLGMHAHPNEWRNKDFMDWLDFGDRTKDPFNAIMRDSRYYERAAARTRPVNLSGLVSLDQGDAKARHRSRLSRWIRSLVDEPLQKLRLTRDFANLSQQWKEDTKYMSSTTEMVLHPAYQRIIGLGPSVVPLVLEEMSARPDHWFWALEALTGENPVDPDDLGRVQKMADAWLNWGKKKKLI